MTEKNISKFLKNKKSVSREEILKKLFLKYHEFVDVFLSKKVDQLSSHHFFDHKIELKSEENSLYYKN